ncbi:hypothetical protein IFR05_010362 [Cadophora sp. M221]|nr:hypothetical protein IFR05_010362 [Cadophora sp. M221]
MEHSSGFNYGGDPPNINSYPNEALPTLGSLNTSDFDFSNMLNFTPPIANSQAVTSNMPGNRRQGRFDMPGNYVSGSEFPFPNLPTSMSQSPSVPVTALDPAALLMTSYSNLPDNGLPRSFSLQDQPEPQAITLPAQREIEGKGDRVTRSVVQKRETPSIDFGDEPKPKRKRGARKKVRSEQEKANKRQDHLRRNREAAQKCRHKKKISETEMQNKLCKERQNNQILWSNIDSVQDELKSLRSFAFDIESFCPFDQHKTEARKTLERIMAITTKLDAQILMCNHRRRKISPGLVMQRASGGYAQQDSIENDPGSMEDDLSPGMSTQSPSYPPEDTRMARSDSYAEVTSDDRPRQVMGTQANGMGGHPMSRGSSYDPRHTNTEFAGDVDMLRKASEDSGAHFNSPAGATKKYYPVEDEAIDNSGYATQEPFSSPESMYEDDFAYFSLL